MKESQAKLINWTAVLLAAICAGGLAWGLGFACGGILTRPNREKVDAELAEYSALAEDRAEACQAAEDEVRGQKLLIAAMEEYLEIRNKRIRILEETIEQQAKEDAGAGETSEAGPLAERRTAGGFSYRNVNFRSNFGFTEAIGEITNGSGRSCDSTYFKISVYDKAKRLLGTGLIDIGSFMPGQTRSFEATISASTAAIDSYKIDFDAAYK